MRTLRHVSIVVLAAVGLALATPALAQKTPSPQDIEQAKEHFAKGKELYDAGDKKAAVEEFKQAYRLSRNPVLLYNIGFVYDELQDTTLAQHYYEKFLNDAPNNEKTKANRQLATDRLKVLSTAPVPSPPAPTVKPPPVETTPKPPVTTPAPPPPKSSPAEVDGFNHVVVEDAPPKRPIDIVAQIPGDVTWKLMLFYRPSGVDDFRVAKMKPRYNEMVGRIPADVVTGDFVQYFIEVKDENGKLVASSGRASSPNIVYLDPTAKPHYYEDLSERGSGSMVGEDGEPGDDPPDGDEPGGDTKPEGPKKPTHSKTFTYLKWGTTGGAVVFLSASIAFYLAAKGDAEALEDEAYNSTMPQNGNCPDGTNPPCTSFSDYQKGLQSAGKSHETWTNVTLFLGIASAGAAGYLWYKALKTKPPEESTERPRDEEARRRTGPRVMGVPVVGDGFVGGAALVEF